MTFKKMEKPNVPPRLWVLVGYPGSGKSTFSTRMKTPLLPIDADHRFEEVIHLAHGDVYELSGNRADSVDPETIYRLLNQNMPGSGVKTIVVDSLTTIITPKVVQAVLDNDAGRNKNKIAAFKDKALSMRLLQDAVTMWGCDVLWIYHLQDARDEKANTVTRPTLSATERARLYRSINLELHIVEETISGSKKTRRGIKVVWARRGRNGMTLWDESGHWEGMPEKIEQAVYGGLSTEAQNQIEQEAPAAFPTEEAAIEWGMSQGVFNAVEHGRNAWQKLKKSNPNLNLARLSTLWVDDIENRLAQKHQQSQETQAPEAATPASETPATGAEAEEISEDLEAFAYQVMVEVGFFEDCEEVAASLNHLKIPYDPEKEEAILELLRVHIQALPTFVKFDDLLFRLSQDFGLKEGEAKKKLRSFGGLFASFPKEGNGEAQARSKRMYWKILMTTPKLKQAEAVEVKEAV